MSMARMANPQTGIFAGVSIGYSANNPMQSAVPPVYEDLEEAERHLQAALDALYEDEAPTPDAARDGPHDATASAADDMDEDYHCYRGVR